ncbi:PP2C family protein-serine/threonine phosphatase [Picosynechococcus sp. PCC 8807]|uniref:PP2C family protein-serine/threonine phosphatase n=1 Tax=Picosynechococcus sp. PCC 8807 TaxID=195248 RepID=UPI000810CAB0|nr:SpoIIE family protein phosphatase [Picosynechococcus sp. PCC 8807]ANV89972.1 regulator [Picosynechococcus sp. PCC 8807]
MPQILVIDDDLAMRVLLERTLKRKGYQVTTASDGKTGLDLAIATRPDLIISDWMMPEMNGIEVCQAVKQHPDLSTTFFILLSALDAVEDKVMGLDAGADDFLCKPISSHELEARVRSGLRICRLTQDLTAQKRALESELTEAAQYVKSLLPDPLYQDHLQIDSCFIPSSQLGGDGFDYFWLSPQELVFYLLDVSGHGLKAALPSISILNLLRSRNKTKGLDYRSPQAVLNHLNRTCQFLEQQGQYFTMWYGIYDVDDRIVTYACAGHPPAVLVKPNTGEPPQLLKAQGFPIGMLPPDLSIYEEHSLYLPFNSRLYLFSDGVYENTSAISHKQQWNLFLNFLQRFQGTSLQPLVKSIGDRLHQNHLEDDFSLLRLTL